MTGYCENTKAVLRDEFNRMTKGKTMASSDEVKAMALEIVEGSRAVIGFAGLPAHVKVDVVKEILDAEIGSDVGAHIPTIPGLTPAMTEMITDPLLELLAKTVVSKFFGADEPA